MANNPLSILASSESGIKSPPRPPSSSSSSGVKKTPSVHITIKLKKSQSGSKASLNTTNKSLLNMPAAAHPLKQRSYAEGGSDYSFKAQSFNFPDPSQLYPTPPPPSPPRASSTRLPRTVRPGRVPRERTITYQPKPRTQSTFAQRRLADGTFVAAAATRTDAAFAQVSDATFARPPAAASATFARPPAATAGTFVRPASADEQTYCKPPGIANPRSYSRHESDAWLYDNSGDYADPEAQDSFFNSTVSSHGSYLMGSPEYNKFKPDVQSSPNRRHAYMIDSTLKSLAALEEHERTQVMENLGAFQRRRREEVSSRNKTAPKQKIIVPKGTIPQNEVAIIEMPKTLRRNSVCIVERKEGKEDEYPSILRPGTTGGYPAPLLPPPPPPAYPSLQPPPPSFPFAPPPQMPSYQPPNVCPAMQAAPVCPGIQPQSCGGSRPMMGSLPMMQMPFPQMGFSQPFQCQPPQQQQQQSQPGAYIMFFYNPAMAGLGRHRCSSQVQQAQCGHQAAPSFPPIQQAQCGQPSASSPIKQSQCQSNPSCQQSPKNNSCAQPQPRESSSRYYELPPGQFGYDCSNERNRNQSGHSVEYDFSETISISSSSNKMSEKAFHEKEEREKKQLEKDLRNFQKARRYFAGQASILADSSASISSGKIRNKNYRRDDEDDEQDEEEEDDFYNEENRPNDSFYENDQNAFSFFENQENENAVYYHPRKMFGKSDFTYDNNNNNKSSKSNKKIRIKNLATPPTKTKYDEYKESHDNDMNEAKETKNKKK